MSQKENPAPRSWYLDPIVAEQKRGAHLDLVARWAGKNVGRLLKTDLFEESNGADQLLFDLSRGCGLAIGLDQDLQIVDRAARRCPRNLNISLLGGDARFMPLQSGSVDAIVSSSTLDHFQQKHDFALAVGELVRVLRPGGVLILTLDNPLNPFYWPLRWLSFAGPFRLGYTPFPAVLRRQLDAAGMEVVGSASLLHNPRVVSTLLFLTIRRLVGRQGDGAIRVLLRCFAILGKLPTRRFTCCFHATIARKR